MRTRSRTHSPSPSRRSRSRSGSWDELDALVDCQFQLEKPLCLVCDDAELLEAALRLYQGRALYEGSLPEATLLPLCEKYGLLI